MTSKSSALVKTGLLLFIFLPLIIGFSYCGGKKGASKPTEDTLILAAYTVPKEAYQKEIIPAFQAYWKQKTGRLVNFKESYNASGAQARAVVAGLDADIAALSLEQDITLLETSGLITHNWRATKTNGFVTRSTVVMVYRPGNPKKIKTWQDLTSPTIDVIYPSPKTSGGAMWIVNAIYGAGIIMGEKETGKKTPELGAELLRKIQAQVRVMDKSGRASVTTFENGFGDVLLTYENEALLRQMQGKDFPFILPDATILIENPIALVDKYVDQHGSRAVAEAFIEFVYQKESQRSFAKYGFRPVDQEILKEFAAKYPVPPMLFDMAYLGGWQAVTPGLYGPEGIWNKIIQDMKNK